MVTPSELYFVGRGTRTLIKKGIELVTIRSKPKGFPPNTEVMGKIRTLPDSKPTNLPLVVISEETHPLGEINEGILLLDGLLSVGAAIDMMRNIYPDTLWNESSSASPIFFLARELTRKLGQHDLPLLSHEPQKTAMTSIRIERFVFPAFYFWLVNWHGIPEERYPEELRKRGVINEKSVQLALEFLEQSKKAKKKDDRDWNHWHFVLTG